MELLTSKRGEIVFPDYPAPSCDQTLNITAPMTCLDIALMYQIPVAALVALNPGITCGIVTDQSVCTPFSCPIGISSVQQSFGPFVANYDNFTEIQFLSWNPLIDPVYIYAGDPVCVGYVYDFNCSHHQR
jgi:hypothetical protein